MDILWINTLIINVLSGYLCVYLYMPTLTAEHPPLTYLVDRKKFKSPPPHWDGKRDIPGTKAALRILWQSRVGDSNVWLCCIHLRSAN